jgi:hypothetical protein
MSPPLRRALRTLVTLVVLATVGALFGRTLAQNWDQVREENLAFDVRMVWCVLLFAAAVPISGVLWKRILDVLDTGGRQVAVIDAVNVQCASWLLKYVPGQVGSVLNKVLWGQRRGISRTLVLITFVYENIFLQLASIVPAVAVLMISTGFGVFSTNMSLVLLPLLVLVPMLLLMSRRTFHAIVSAAGRRVLKSEIPETYFLHPRDALRLQAEFLIPRLLNGVGFVLATTAVVDVGSGAWLPLASAYVLAGAIGILAVFVPSGLGVRESIIVIFASSYMSVSEAIVVALLARLLSVISDAVIAAIYGVTAARRRAEVHP